VTVICFLVYLSVALAPQETGHVWGVGEGVCGEGYKKFITTLQNTNSFTCVCNTKTTITFVLETIN